MIRLTSLFLVLKSGEALITPEVHLSAQKWKKSPMAAFGTSQCRAAIGRQRAQFDSYWQAMVGNGGHDYDTVISHEGSTLAYVSNQKVGSSSMQFAFGALDHEQSFKHAVPYSAVQHPREENHPHIHQWVPNINTTQFWNLSFAQGKLKDKFLFTVVRDPLATAWSGYTEVSHRAGDDLALVTPCNTSDDRYLEYLDLMKNGRLRAEEAYHSFPQSVKVDVLKTLNRDSFDFIVRLEHFEVDMRALFAQLKNPPVETTIQEFLHRFNHWNEQNPHSRDSSCDQDIEKTSSEIGLNDQTCRVACDLYDSDFACFGYTRPKCCL